MNLQTKITTMNTSKFRRSSVGKVALLLGAVTLGTALSALPASAYERGVNMAGLGFAGQVLPGVVNTNYTINSPASYRYFGAKKLTLIRVSIQWERLQPTLDGPLDSAYLDALKQNVAWAKQYNGKVIIDLHNYGRYSINEGGTYHNYVMENPYDGVTKVTTENLTNVWVKLSQAFKNEPTVYAYDLMNEPYDMGKADWKAISQAAVTAIRKNSDKKLIYVPGNEWSSADRWLQNNGPKSWITDPAHNFKYEAHIYFDHDTSGTYSWTYDKELAANPNLATVGVTRLNNFITWCQANGVEGYLGEFGIPNTDPRWSVVLDNFYTTLDRAGFDGTIWAAGEWWADNPLSVQPTNDFKTDSVVMPILLKHLGRPSEKVSQK